MPTQRPTDPRLRQFAEALIQGLDESETAAEFGLSRARQGEGLDVCLGDLDDTYLAVHGEAAPPPVVRATALAWAETMQEHYNCLTCADPLTGLSSIHHLQSEVAALYRAAEEGWLAERDVPTHHAIVVVDLPEVHAGGPRRFSELTSALRHAAAAELVRELLPEAVQPARLNPHRIVALVRRCDGVHRRLAELTARLDQRLALTPTGGRSSAWTEALPDHAQHARRLLDELAR